MEGLTEGRIVHFVMPEDSAVPGEHRPAIVVKVWDVGIPGYINLQVFTDGSNDGQKYADCPYWAPSVNYSEGKEPRTWHWIEKA